MKGLLVFTVFFFFTLTGQEITEVRKAYRHAAENQTKAEDLYSSLNHISKDDDIVLFAYKGATATILSKYQKGAKAKISLFKEGKNMIEEAVTAEPENIELRYIRLSVQENAPKVLRYKKEIAKDKQFIIDHFSEALDAETKKYIKGFIAQSRSFSEAEKQLF